MKAIGVGLHGLALLALLLVTAPFLLLGFALVVGEIGYRFLAACWWAAAA